MTAFSLERIGSLLIGAAGAILGVAWQVALIVLGGYVLARLAQFLLARVEHALVRLGEPTEPYPGATRKRVSTLTGLLRTLALGLVWVLVTILSLRHIGLDITPILAGAGIVGLAVGFGAQNLVRDLISGFFLVMENQIRVGDVVTVNGTGGLVEAITFRIIVLRDLAGVVHVFPHGTVNTLANLTKEWSAYLIDVGVAYKEDTDRVVEVMREVADRLREDPAFAPTILEPIEIFGVDRFGDSEVVIKARIKTQPLQQWNVGREYRRRLKKAFDQAGIEIPFPHRSLYVGEASKPLPVVLAGAGNGRSHGPGRGPGA
jgi:small conductance mechanosensitive channel